MVRSGPIAPLVTIKLMDFPVLVRYPNIVYDTIVLISPNNYNLESLLRYNQHIINENIEERKSPLNYLT